MIDPVRLVALGITLAACSHATQSEGAYSPEPSVEQSGAERSPDTLVSGTHGLARSVTKLADEYVREYVAAFPEDAFLSGFTLPSHSGLSDNSEAALRTWHEKEDRWWSEVADIDADLLWGRSAWITYGFLREVLETSRLTRVCRSELWPVSQLFGWQSTFADLAAIQPVGTPQKRDEALARWRKVSKYLDTEVVNLRHGMTLGYTTPRHNVGLAIQQLDEILQLPAEESPFYSPAERDSAPEFRKAWRALLTDQVNPAITRYRDFLRTEYLPKTRVTIAVTAHPNGDACYKARFRSFTSLVRSPQETFALGERHVARNEADIARIGRQEFGSGDVAALRRRVNTDPANRFSSRDELLAFTKAALGRARTALPKWFGRLPKARAMVKPQPEFLAGNAGDHYEPPAEDGSRPGVYMISLYQPEKTLRSMAEATAFHEIYPGHHLQIALAQEQPDAHPINRLAGTKAFVEGWGRYAELLAEEMGLYTTTFARLGRRSWPGHGMVVDPGIHVFGWSRTRAVEYVRKGRRPGAEALVDRVVVWPAQLTAYDTGALEILGLRERAARELGPDFDIREFHDRILANGAITLPMLHRVIDRWIAEKKKT